MKEIVHSNRPLELSIGVRTRGIILEAERASLSIT